MVDVPNSTEISPLAKVHVNVVINVPFCYNVGAEG